MTRFTSFFEKPLVGIVTILGSAITKYIGLVIEHTKPLIGYITIVFGAITAVCIASLWIRKVIRTAILDFRKRSIMHEQSDRTNPPFKL